MWWFIKELTAGLVLCWKHSRQFKPRWRCEPGEVSPHARALMLGAVQGVSGPLVSGNEAQNPGGRKGEG
jgi:hypothetical protein